MSDQQPDGITVKEITKGTSEGDPETRYVFLWSVYKDKLAKNCP